MTHTHVTYTTQKYRGFTHEFVVMNDDGQACIVVERYTMEDGTKHVYETNTVAITSDLLRDMVKLVAAHPIPPAADPPLWDVTDRYTVPARS